MSQVYFVFVFVFARSRRAHHTALSRGLRASWHERCMLHFGMSSLTTGWKGQFLCCNSWFRKEAARCTATDVANTYKHVARAHALHYLSWGQYRLLPFHAHANLPRHACGHAARAPALRDPEQTHVLSSSVFAIAIRVLHRCGASRCSRRPPARAPEPALVTRPRLPVAVPPGCRRGARHPLGTVPAGAL